MPYTDPNSTDRSKLGTKRHAVADRRYTPLAARITGTNRNDSAIFKEALDTPARFDDRASTHVNAPSKSVPARRYLVLSAVPNAALHQDSHRSQENRGAREAGSAALGGGMDHSLACSLVYFKAVQRHWCASSTENSETRYLLLLHKASQPISIPGGVVANAATVTLWSIPAVPGRSCSFGLLKFVSGERLDYHRRFLAVAGHAFVVYLRQYACSGEGCAAGAPTLASASIKWMLATSRMKR